MFFFIFNLILLSMSLGFFFVGFFSLPCVLYKVIQLP